MITLKTKHFTAIHNTANKIKNGKSIATVTGVMNLPVWRDAVLLWLLSNETETGEDNSVI